MTKITNVTGQHEFSYDRDGIDPGDGSSFVHFNDMVPYGTTERRGRWRITVEFEPEEER